LIHLLCLVFSSWLPKRPSLLPVRSNRQNGLKWQRVNELNLPVRNLTAIVKLSLKSAKNRNAWRKAAIDYEQIVIGLLWLQARTSTLESEDDRRLDMAIQEFGKERNLARG
jgi:hypothetical protein